MKNTSGFSGAATVMALVLGGCLLGAGGAARADTSVQVVSTDPSGDVVALGTHQNFYLHLEYQSDRPVQIWARPYFRGSVVQAGSNPSRVYPAGSGEALGWFFLFEPDARVDEVRISAGDGTRAGTPVVAVHPVQVLGTDGTLARNEKPEWVTRLSALDAEAQDADYERRMNAPVSDGDRLLMGGFMLAMLAVGLLGFVAPAWGLWRWRGGWRIAAALPAALMTFVVLRIVVEVSFDPTSHNLWPFEILMTGALSVALMLVAVAARKLAGANRVP
jgi:hypothetical protein